MVSTTKEELFDDDGNSSSGPGRVCHRGNHRSVVQGGREAVAEDEIICELETDKVTVEVPAPAAGVLSKINAAPGDTVEVGVIIGAIAEGNGASSAPPSAPAAASQDTEKSSTGCTADSGKKRRSGCAGE